VKDETYVSCLHIVFEATGQRAPTKDGTLQNETFKLLSIER